MVPWEAKKEGVKWLTKAKCIKNLNLHQTDKSYSYKKFQFPLLGVSSCRTHYQWIEEAAHFKLTYLIQIQHTAEYLT